MTMFKDLPKEEQQKCLDALITGHLLVKWNEDAWLKVKTISLNGVYKIEETQDTIPWEVISPKYQWATRDDGGAVYVSEELPVILSPGSACWVTMGGVK